MTESIHVGRRPVDVDQHRPFQTWGVRPRCVEKGGCGFIIRRLTCLSKFADQLSQRIVRIFGRDEMNPVEFPFGRVTSAGGRLLKSSIPSLIGL